MIAQVSHFTMLERLLRTTHVLQFSRLLRIQWRKKLRWQWYLISWVHINVDQLWLHKMQMSIRPLWAKHICDSWKCENRHMCFILLPQTHLRMAKKHHYSQVIVISKPDSSFCGMRSWPSQNNEVQNQSFVCCAQMCFWWLYKRLDCFLLYKTYVSHITL